MGGGEGEGGDGDGDGDGTYSSKVTDQEEKHDRCANNADEAHRLDSSTFSHIEIEVMCALSAAHCPVTGDCRCKQCQTVQTVQKRAKACNARDSEKETETATFMAGRPRMVCPSTDHWAIVA